MTLLLSAVRRLEEVVRGSGCDDGAVTIRRKPGEIRCQFERGATLAAAFGGCTAHVTTASPVQTETRVSSLFGRELPTPELRTAALAMVNGVTGFLCLSRKLHACDPRCHGPCLTELQGRIRGRRIFTPVKVPVLGESLVPLITVGIGEAEILVLTGEALVSEEEPGWEAESGPGGEILLLGPSTGGVASLLSLTHWCPYGR